jgi:hypothetical protein
MSQNGSLNGPLSSPTGSTLHNGMLGVGGPNGSVDEMVQSSASSTSSTSSQNNENIQRVLHHHHHAHMNGMGVGGGHHHNHNHHHSHLHHNSHQPNQQLSPDHSPPTSANAPWSLYAPATSSAAHLHNGGQQQLTTIGASFGPGGSALTSRSIIGLNQLRLIEFSGFVEKRRDPDIVSFYLTKIISTYSTNTFLFKVSKTSFCTFEHIRFWSIKWSRRPRRL